jgi:copper chaperone CopZ
VAQRTLSIDGMSCGHCVARVRKALEAVQGVTVADVQVGSARIDVDKDEIVNAAVRAVADAGFSARSSNG